MHCDEFEAQWQAALDARLSLEDNSDLRTHAEACGPCRRLWTGHETLLAGLELFDPPAMRDDFAARVVAQFQGEKSSKSQLTTVTIPAEPILAERANPEADASAGVVRLIWIAVTGLAALVAIAAYVATSGPFASPVVQKDTAPPQPVAVSPAPPKQPVEKPIIAPVPEPMLSPTEGLAAGARNDQTLALNELLGAVRAQLPADAEQQSSEYAAEVVDRFRPVATPVTSLFNVFLGTLPGGKEKGPREPQSYSPFMTGETQVG